MRKTPFLKKLGAKIEKASAKRSEISLRLKPWHLNRRGVAHGGVVMTLLDSSLGLAVISSMPKEWWCATTSLSVQFLLGATGKLTATGRVMRRGRSVAFARGEIRNDRNELIATAEGTWHLWHQKPPAVKRT